MRPTKHERKKLMQNIKVLIFWTAFNCNEVFSQTAQFIEDASYVMDIWTEEMFSFLLYTKLNTFDIKLARKSKFRSVLFDECFGISLFLTLWYFRL